MYLPEPEEEQQQCTDAANIPRDQKQLQTSSFSIRFKDKFIRHAQGIFSKLRKNIKHMSFGFIWNYCKHFFSTYQKCF